MQYISKIEKICAEKKVTKRSLAAKIGITEQGFHGMLREKSMKISTLQDIADFFQVPITWFFEDESKPVPGPDIDRVFEVMKEMVRREMK